MTDMQQKLRDPNRAKKGSTNLIRRLPPTDQGHQLTLVDQPLEEDISCCLG